MHGSVQLSGTAALHPCTTAVLFTTRNMLKVHRVAHPDPLTAEVVAIPGCHCVLSVPGILVLDEGEGWRPGGQLQVDVSDAPILVEQVVELSLTGVQRQVAHEDCARHAAAAVAVFVSSSL